MSVISKIISSLYIALLSLLGGGNVASTIPQSSPTAPQTTPAPIVRIVPKSNSNNNDTLPTQSFPTPTSPSTGFQPTSTSGNITSNWSGYASLVGAYTSVSGTWTVPNVTGGGQASADAAWVGIGGISTSDLIQVGTQNIVSPSGQVSTSAFFETLPAVSQPITSVPVHPGDSISASVARITGNEWVITLTDSTTGNTYTGNVTYNSSLSSAEWIEEAPSSLSGQLPLDSFGAVAFSSASTVKNGITLDLPGSGASMVNMVNLGGQSLVNVSAIGADNASFTVTRTNIASTTTYPQYSRQHYSWPRRGHGMMR